MKPLTPKQQKIAWIVGGVLLFIHFLPTLTASIRQQFAHSRTAPPAQVRNAPQSVAPIAVKAVPPPDPLAMELVGRFGGQQLESDLENCRVSLEVKPAVLQIGFYSAYESRSCVPSALAYRGPLTAARAGQLPNIIEAASPVSTSMSGSIVDGSMKFRIDQVVGATAHHCGPRSYSISPFGTGQIMAQWEEPSPCNKTGHMVLVKAKG